MQHFSVWAPRRKSVTVQVNSGRYVMESRKHGWWRADVEDAGHGCDYGFLIDDDPQVYPDPRAAWQPYDVHGASRVYDHSRFQWTDEDFKAASIHKGVVYEIHIGTFTQEGTFAAAEKKLSLLRELGVTHIEVMPLNSFAGIFGWGYDGVALYAPQQQYGGPDGLKHFVDACHANQLAVLLDVVYNHFGPVGNYTGKFGPYITDLHHTPWGGAVNLEEYGSTEVRRFFCDNALMWLRDYHFDGLRLDAIQSYADRSATHFLEQLSEEVDLLSSQLGRPLVLVAESDLNDPRVVTPLEENGRRTFGYGMDAQWSDDFHHSLFALLTGQRRTYYSDFGSVAQVAKSLTSVFVYDGVYSEFRGRIHGRPVLQIDRTRFFGYLQNHDQIGNQAFGDRLCCLVDARKTRLAAAMILTAPFVPMLFQGEEFGASTPFLYFANHDDPVIARAVSEGRRLEHAHEGDAESVPDPEDFRTFQASKLKWEEREQGEHAKMLTWHRDLIQLRQSNRCLLDGSMENTKVEFDERAQWLLMTRSTGSESMYLYFNFGNCPTTLEAPASGVIAIASEDGVMLEAGKITLPESSFAAVSAAEE